MNVKLGCDLYMTDKSLKSVMFLFPYERQFKNDFHFQFTLKNAINNKSKLILNSVVTSFYTNYVNE